MDALLWSDYLCPWCYVGQVRTAKLRELGLAVTALPFELHPEIGPAGRTVRSDGRLGPTFDRIEAECDEAGLPFRRPTRMPNTHRALATAEVVRTEWPEAFDALDTALFAAQFATGDPLDDSEVIDSLVSASGAPADEVRDRVADIGDTVLAASMAAARDAGVAGTPTWVVGSLTIPGALPTETLERWVRRLLERATPD
ncbi:MAG TPA: DsbA family protein [Acidimicrobiales bacterium]|jgi:predicted DsbA family dithiol-disulfide isomerase|nr:DsbA family protein [Acidimicrobiales bacterium]